MARPRRRQIMSAFARGGRRTPGPRRPAVRRNLSIGRRAGRGGGRGGGGGGRPGGGGGPAPLPWDSQAERQSAELGNEAGDTRASLSASWQAQQEEMGLGAGANNPYSHAAMLKRQRDANQRGITNTAGRNLYAGSTVNAQRQATDQYDRGNKQLQDAFHRSKAAYERGTAQTDRDYQLGVSRIKEGALNRALSTEPAPQAVGGGRGRRQGQQRRQRRAIQRRKRQNRLRRRRR